MGESTITVVAIFLAAILMFLVPLISITERGDDVSQSLVQTSVSNFVQEAAKDGYISEESYNTLCANLGATGNTYDIRIEVQKLDDNPGKKAAVTSKDLIGENADYSVFTSIILEALENDGKYNLNQGDKIVVTVGNTNMTLAQLFRNFMYKINGNENAIEVSASAMATRTGL